MCHHSVPELNFASKCQDRTIFLGTPIALCVSKYNKRIAVTAQIKYQSLYSTTTTTTQNHKKIHFDLVRRRYFSSFTRIDLKEEWNEIGMEFQEEWNEIRMEFQEEWNEIRMESQSWSFSCLIDLVNKRNYYSNL